MTVPQTNLERKIPMRRIGWKQGKEEELLEFISERSARGISIVESLKEFAKQNGISWTTARWKYYRLRQQREANSRLGRGFGDDNIFRELGRILNNVSGIQEMHLKPFVSGLATLTELAHAGHQLATKVETIGATLQQLESELSRLAGAVDSWRDSSPGSKLSTIDDLASVLDQSLLKISSIISTCQVEIKGK